MTKIGSIVFVIAMSFSFSVFAKATKVLVESSNYNMLDPSSSSSLRLMDDGSFMLKVGKKRVKKVARLKDQASIDEVLELIRQIPAKVKLVETSVNSVCESDGGYYIVVYGDQFSKGQTISSSDGCRSESIKGAGKAQAEELTQMMFNAENISYK